MNQNLEQEHSYLKAKKRVKAIKGFYIHVSVYVITNIFLSGIIIFGLMSSGYIFLDAFSAFGVYSTWIFWGIGIFFHWLGTFGFQSLGLGKDWEDKKIRELMEKEDNRRDKF
jgi:hypothetical protein